MEMAKKAMEMEMVRQSLSSDSIALIQQPLQFHTVFQETLDASSKLAADKAKKTLQLT